MDIIDWDNINQNYLQDIYSIYDNFVNIEDEKEKIKEIFFLLFSRYFLNVNIIKNHIKAFYFLEYIEHINIIPIYYIHIFINIDINIFINIFFNFL